MPLFTIDPDRCNRDGLCAAECPVGCIVFEQGALPVPHEKKQAYCLSCGHCLAVCPADAIRLERFRSGGVRKDKALNITFEQAGQFLKGRRSVRAFKADPLDRGALEGLLAVTEYGPSGHNARLTRWAVAATPDKVAEVAGAVVGWMRAQVADATPLADALHLSGIVRVWDQGQDMICRSAPVLAVAYGPEKGITPKEDGVIAVTYLELAATAAGLGACWCGYVPIAAAHDRNLCRLLGVPEGHVVYGALVLGRPVRRVAAIPPRPMPGVHWL
ncbi:MULTISPECIES: nitroreductase family protein [unclassified Pseudodesulfovibrio]|uniref:nitroreductase family protein n=1 Tax=unclassified Pseudodesulfovibrio TaxID=2661612 RepID=UPI000FEBD1A9|nr:MULTISPECIES: nitroreductase family protein [unclassified Pseudodesulfovibrio]MCJ2164824.1 nitroreductase family protein [Pseudodesulfovibrio sp. S3-i]RWU03806.1 nitroreductase [Pseudodesulfovibrio sp. S3]